MDSFLIKNDNEHIKITFDEVYGFPDSTSHWGGYDVRTLLEIESGSFQVKSTLWTSTGEIFELFQKLKECNEKIDGTIIFKSCEGDLNLKLSYDKAGHINISGSFFEFGEFNNKLQFEFVSDQSFMKYTISELELIADKYGDMKGLKK